MQNAIVEFLHSSHSCLLLVSPDIQKLEETVARLSSTYDYPCLSVDQELCAALLSTAPKHRSHAADRWTRSRLDEFAPGPIVITGITLLFDPSLRLDPLKLMRDVGKRTRMIVAWPGNYVSDVLSYAVPSHGHYRTWQRPPPGLKIVALG